MLFDWLVIGQIVPFNPTSSVRGPKYSIKKGRTPVMSGEDARKLLDRIDTSNVVGLRDRDYSIGLRRACPSVRAMSAEPSDKVGCSYPYFPPWLHI